MGHPENGTRLLLMHEDPSANHTTSLLAANELKYMNTDRKIIENQIVLEAVELAKQQLEKYPHSLVLYKPNWHSGVIGIVAARIAEQFYRPAIILSEEGGMLKGSGRSVGNFDLHGALKKCSDCLLGFGGHTAAAGVQLQKNQLDAFMQAFDNAVRDADISNVCTLLVDGNITMDQMYDIRFALFLENIEPLGSGNSELLLRLDNVKILSVSDRREVMNLIIQDEAERTLMVGRYKAPEEYRTFVGKKVSMLLSPMLNYFGGTTSVEWRIHSIKEIK
jgi:single-stranded-DNA-specific exonuclease